ncbi:DUF2262 domain-containing protein [Deinococcus maricopensis]|uniref:DUF2262 domain-containing protein n=1 Tax=Deinococcus maricopensis (strain DSM 21211 / LMG 22137 / NRRL B-23946 / LB-34) TaxID=709986 RepID=E8U8C1_DEIML|nr:DUF2262 domain-containing protein [Deinococcus maricopensis]ADV67310.1 hypothetical protein Deima_1661 [Deinococcus maricopensis DSM 21211]
MTGAYVLDGVGTLRREEFEGWPAPLVQWSAQARTDHGDVEVVLYDEPLTEERLASAGAAVRAFLAEMPDRRALVAARLLPLARSWFENAPDQDDAGPLTADAFAALLTLTSLTVDVDGTVTAYYDDHHQVFAGHVVQGVFGADGQLLDADIPG